MGDIQVQLGNITNILRDSNDAAYTVRPILSSGRVILKEDCIELIKQRGDESLVQENIPFSYQSSEVYNRNKLVATETDMRRAARSFASIEPLHGTFLGRYGTSLVPFLHML